MEKIDIHNAQAKYEATTKKLKEDISKANAKLILDFLDASAIGKTARRGARRKQAGTKTRLKNLFGLKICANFFNGSLVKISVKDMERFIRALNENTIKKKNGESYSEQTKSNVKKTYIAFLRYYLGEKSKEFDDLTGWIETTFKSKTTIALREDEILKLVDNVSNLRQKVTIALLFDLGARIEEFLNIRLGDIEEVGGEVSYYRITLREEFSKTLGRTISVTWGETNELLKRYLKDHKQKGDLEAPLFDWTYGSVRKMLAVQGKKTLGKNISPHGFRHASASFYAERHKDYFALCRKYGWTYTSKVPQGYLDRRGAHEGEEKQIDDFKAETLDAVKEKLAITEQRFRTNEDKLKATQKSLVDLKQDIAGFMEHFKIYLAQQKQAQINGA